MTRREHSEDRDVDKRITLKFDLKGIGFQVVD